MRRAVCCAVALAGWASPLLADGEQPPGEPDSLVSAIDLGIAMAGIMGAFMHYTPGDNATVFQMHRRASSAAAALKLDVPLPPPCGPLAGTDSGSVCPGVAEGLRYSIRAIRTVRDDLEQRYGEAVSAAFMFSSAVLAAHLFKVDESLRETWLEQATRASDTLDLPMEFVEAVYQHVQHGDASNMLADMEKLKQLLTA